MKIKPYFIFFIIKNFNTYKYVIYNLHWGIFYTVGLSKSVFQHLAKYAQIMSSAVWSLIIR